MNLINLYMLSTWLPTIARGMGLTATAALMIGTMFQTGGAVGSIAIARPIDKWGFFGVLIACFAGAGVMIALIGQPGLSVSMLFVVVFLAGFGIFSGQAGNNAVAATYYPTDAAFDRRGCGARHRPHRIDSRSVRRRVHAAALFHASAVPRLRGAGISFRGRRRIAPRGDEAGESRQARESDDHPVSQRTHGRHSRRQKLEQQRSA